LAAPCTTSHCGTVVPGNMLLHIAVMNNRKIASSKTYTFCLTLGSCSGSARKRSCWADRGASRRLDQRWQESGASYTGAASRHVVATAPHGCGTRHFASTRARRHQPSPARQRSPATSANPHSSVYALAVNSDNAQNPSQRQTTRALQTPGARSPSLKNRPRRAEPLQKCTNRR